MKRIAPAKEQRPDFLDLRDAFWILRRQVRLVLLTVGIGLGGALLYLAYATPLYTATALLFVDPSQKNILNPDDAYTLQGSAENARIESEVEILRSDTVMLAAIDAAGLLADPEFGPSLPLLDKLRMAVGLEGGDTRSGAELLSSTLARLTGRVDVRRRGTTYLIAVSVHAQSPDRAATIANAVAQTYIDLQIGTKVSAALAMRDMLQGQLDAARLALTENESALASYVDDNIDRLVVESGSEAARDLRDRLLEANARSGQTRDLLTNARTLMQDQDWSGLAARLEDEALAQMDAERAALAAQLGVQARQADTVQVFYRLLGQAGYSEAQSVRRSHDTRGGEPIRLEFSIDSPTGFVPELRIDPVDGPGEFRITDLRVTCRLWAPQ